MNQFLKPVPVIDDEINEATLALYDSYSKLEKDLIKNEHDFYNISIKNSKLDGIFIDKVKLVNVFVKLGFCRFDIDDKHLMVYLHNNTIKRATPKMIRDVFFKYIDNLKVHKIVKQRDSTEVTIAISGPMLKRKFFDSLETYFSPLIFERACNVVPLEIQTDEQETKYFYFKNGFVIINAKGHKFLKYTELKNVIWETSILHNNFKYTSEKGNFEKFFENITGINDEYRKESLMSICGYLLHSFYDYKTFLILLADAGLNLNGEPNGRSGKTLLMKGLGKMLMANDKQTRYVLIDGKTFKSNEDRKYQRADIDTSLIHINDIYKWFDIENLFVDITDGITVRQMYEKPFTIFSKLAMSSNKTIKLDGPSSRDRVIVYEIDNFYSDTRNPETEFKQWFFRDWDAIEWNKFYSFMIRCCIIFFQKGILKPIEINYHTRLLFDYTSKEFVAWFGDYWHKIESEMQSTSDDIHSSKKMMYHNFISEYEDYQKASEKFSQKKMTIWMQQILKHKKIIYKESRLSEDLFIYTNIYHDRPIDSSIVPPTRNYKQQNMNFNKPVPQEEPVTVDEENEVIYNNDLPETN